MTMNPKYPIYIISKGRWESRLTVKSLEKIKVPYKICVEPNEYKRYSEVIDSNNIYKLPENFSERGKGSIPVRNWVWEHAIKKGVERYWIFDDNINGFFRFNKNLKTPVGSGTIFRCAEDFTDRFENVAISGLNYFMFVSRKSTPPPFYLNTRIYSMILIKADLPYRWRGRYNEDTDLSIRVLKDGWCTILFNAFLGCKSQTMTMKGGNTDTIYNTGDNRKEFAESLKRQHPDIVKVVWKWGRWHHSVNYKPFEKNKLRLKPSICIPEGINNYGMVLKRISD